MFDANVMVEPSGKQLIFDLDRVESGGFGQADRAVHVRRHPGNTTGQDFAAFGHKLLQQIRILVVDRLRGDVDAAPRHRAVGAAESGAAFGGLRLHDG